jgi:Transglutaminase-like superfamily
MLDRRDFLKFAVSAAALGAGARSASADPLAFSAHGDWRGYEIRTVVQIDLAEPTRVWVPVASFADPLWSRGVRAMRAPLGGKCADINGLFVGLARAAGLPARDLYGVRVASSRFGCKSLGAGSADVTKAQHCRADLWLEGLGWTPMDAADVRKVMLEEPPKNLSADDPKVSPARAALIGGCEGQLGRLQLRPRSGAPRLDGRANRLPHVSGRRGRRRASRPPRAGYVPLPDPRSPNLDLGAAVNSRVPATGRTREGRELAETLGLGPEQGHGLRTLGDILAAKGRHEEGQRAR